MNHQGTKAPRFLSLCLGVLVVICPAFADSPAPTRQWEFIVIHHSATRAGNAEAFDAAGRAEQAQGELDEAEVLAEYLPSQLDDAELEALVAQAVAEVTEQLGAPPGQKQMGQVMKAANAKVAGRAEGGRVAALVRARLTG